MIATKSHPDNWYGTHVLATIASTTSVLYRILPAGSLTMLYGGSGRYKTFFILALLRSCALGLPFMGRRTEPQTCILLAAEGGHDVHLRHAGLDQYHCAPSAILIDQARPEIDQESGFWYLLALLYESTSGLFEFPEIEDFIENCPHQYFTDGEVKELEEARKWIDKKAFEIANQNPDEVDDSEYLEAKTYLKELEARTNQAARTRYTGRDAIFASVFEKGYSPDRAPSHGNILLVIDTYSATAPDDTKPTVARYFRNLKDLQARIAAQGGCLTVIFVDHCTKNESTFVGAGDKYNSSDVAFEVVLRGKNGISVKSDKEKSFARFDDLHLTMKPIEIDGFIDELGAPLSTLVAVDDTNTPDTEEVAPKATKATASSMLRDLIREHSPIADDALRGLFFTLPMMATKKPDTQRTAYRRALETLQDDFSIEVENEIVQIVDGDIG